MGKSSLFDEFVASIPEDVKREVDLAFAINDRIHALLGSSGMTQRELAQKMGKKESEVSKLLSGTHNFTMRTLAKLEAALGGDIIVAASEEKRREAMWVVSINPHEDRATVAYGESIRPSERLTTTFFS